MFSAKKTGMIELPCIRWRKHDDYVQLFRYRPSEKWPWRDNRLIWWAPVRHYMRRGPWRMSSDVCQTHRLWQRRVTDSRWTDIDCSRLATSRFWPVGRSERSSLLCVYRVDRGQPNRSRQHGALVHDCSGIHAPASPFYRRRVVELAASAIIAGPAWCD